MKTIVAFALLFSSAAMAMPPVPSTQETTVQHCVGIGNAVMALRQRVISRGELNAEHEYITSHKEMPQWLKDINLWMQELALAPGGGSSVERGTAAMLECMAYVNGAVQQ